MDLKSQRKVFYSYALYFYLNRSGFLIPQGSVSLFVKEGRQAATILCNNRSASRVGTCLPKQQRTPEWVHKYAVETREDAVRSHRPQENALRQRDTSVRVCSAAVSPRWSDHPVPIKGISSFRDFGVIRMSPTCHRSLMMVMLCRYAEKQVSSLRFKHAKMSRKQ